MAHQVSNPQIPVPGQIHAILPPTASFQFVSTDGRLSPTALQFLQQVYAQLNSLMVPLAAYHDGTFSGIQISDETPAPIGAITASVTESEFDLALGGWVFSITINTAYAKIKSSNRFITDYGSGFLFSDLPTGELGMVTLIIDSPTNIWGDPIVIGGGGNSVLAMFNGANWSVIGR